MRHDVAKRNRSIPLPFAGLATKIGSSLNDPAGLARYRRITGSVIIAIATLDLIFTSHHASPVRIIETITQLGLGLALWFVNPRIPKRSEK